MTEAAAAFYFDQAGITDKTVEARRISVYFVPIPPSKKKSGGEELVLGTEWTKDRSTGSGRSGNGSCSSARLRRWRQRSISRSFPANAIRGFVRS